MIYPLHATSHTTPYLSLLARYNNFSEEGWKAFCAEQSIFLTRCMRGTLHYLPQTLKPTISALYKEMDVEVDAEEGEKTTSGKRYDTSGLLEKYEIPAEEAETLSGEIIKAITKHGPQNTVSIKKLLPKKLIKKRELGVNVGIVMRRMLSLGRLEYGTTASPRVTWRKKERLFSIPPSTQQIVVKQPLPSYELALVNLAFFYFERYGPASVDDFIWWAGLSPLTCRVAVKTIQMELVHVRVTGIEEDLFMLKNQLDSLKECADVVPKMTRMLPYEDAVIKAYKATRYRFFGEKDESIDLGLRHAITKGGEAKPTIWVDGAIVGVWSWTNKPNQPIAICLFKNLNKVDKKRVEEEIAVVSKFIESSGASWVTI